MIDEIVGESREPGVDLIVTSTHGRSGLKRAVIGSVAEHVVQYAECPVLTVPSGGALNMKGKLRKPTRGIGNENASTIKKEG